MHIMMYLLFLAVLSIVFLKHLLWHNLSESKIPCCEMYKHSLLCLFVVCGQRDVPPAVQEKSRDSLLICAKSVSANVHR